METLTETEAGLREILQNKVTKLIESRQGAVQNALMSIEKEGQLMGDYIAPLGMGGKINFMLAETDDLRVGRLEMKVGNEAFALHKHAITQSAEKLGIPTSYINGLQGTEWGRLLSRDILNEHTMNGKRQRLLIRTVGREVRGVLSDSYRRLDTPKIFGQFIQAVGLNNAKIVDAYKDDTRAYIETINPKLIEVKTDKNGVIYLAYGVRISSSDYGDGALEIRSFMMQAVCLNGMVTEKAMKTIHLGARLPDDLEVSRKTYELDTQTQASLCYDMAKQMLSEKAVDEKIRFIQGATKESIDIEKEIVKIAKKGLITKEEGNEITKVLMENKPEDGVQGEGTLWKLAQGVGAVAREKEGRRMRELQEVAGGLLVSAN